MSLTARKIIDAQTVYTFLENSFYEVFNSLKQQGLIENGDINFAIYKSQADFDGTISVPLYAEDEQAQRINHGLLRFITGQVDPSRLSNVFSQSYSFEMLAFETDREDIRRVFTSMASTINAKSFNFSDSNGDFTAFASVEEFPPMSQTIDANGADKFIISLVFVFLFYQDAVHYSNVYMSMNGVRPEFEEITFNRQLVEPAVDMKKTFENKYVPSKTGFGINVSGYYIANNATNSFVRWIMDESKLSDSIRFFYSDGVQIKSGQYLIADAKVTVPFESIVQYTMSMIPSRDATQTHRGIYVKNANGTGDYPIGSSVTLTADSFKDNLPFSGWTVEYSSNGSFTISNPNNASITFTMPNSDLILRANYQAQGV